MVKSAAIITATLAGSAAAFAPQVRTVRYQTVVNEAAEAAAPVEEIEEVAEVTETPAAATASTAFAGGMVGGEGPEPMPFTTANSSVNFDPAGFIERSPEWLPWYREAELKHGRAAMLATVGFVAPEFFRIPGERFSFEAIPNVIDAHDALPDSMAQIFLWISLIEAMSFPALANMNEYDRRPGDFGFDPLGLYPTTEEKQREMQLAELKNGRLAMIAIGGMVTGTAITGVNHFPYF